QEFADVVQRFDRGGFTVEVSDRVPSSEYTAAVRDLGGMERVLAKLEEPSTPAAAAAALEFVLEGLHLGKRLNKTPLEGSAVYGG
ncbi:MAG TPA: magnesium chelatase, partial [Candidatus Dormibacteraeota bacterium]|nr:magnesium chelatase [Candidatus Dormibacteraeota bacterium]